MLPTPRVSKDFDVPDTPLQDISNSQLKVNMIEPNVIESSFMMLNLKYIEMFSFFYLNLSYMNTKMLKPAPRQSKPKSEKHL